METPASAPTPPQALTDVWSARAKLRAEGDKLRAEGAKLWAEGAKLRAEGAKLWAEGAKLWAEGDKLWAEAILGTVGNVLVDWSDYPNCTVEGWMFTSEENGR